MEPKKRIALNRNFALFIAIGLLLAMLAYGSFLAEETGVGVGLGLFAVFAIAAPIVAMPWYYVFDPESVSIKYIFFPQERYLWKNICYVSVVDAVASGSEHSLFLYDFKLEGNVEGKLRRYMDGRISKSWRTKRLIEKYWDGTIEGYWHDEVQAVKKWWNKRVTKKQLQHKRHSIDEVVLMERQARASVRTWLEPFEAEARQYDLQVRTQYLYITEDYEESHSRPETAHTYTAVIDICRPNETDEDRMIILYTDMINVRLGKKAYRGVVNAQAEKEFKESFSEILTEIKQNGVEAFLELTVLNNRTAP